MMSLKMLLFQTLKTVEIKSKEYKFSEILQFFIKIKLDVLLPILFFPIFLNQKKKFPICLKFEILSFNIIYDFLGIFRRWYSWR